MKRVSLLGAAVCTAVLAVHCKAPDSTDAQRTGETARQAQALAVTAAGAIPAQLPSRLEVGLREDKGGTWMQSSGVPWDARYMYLTAGWANNWGYGSDDGSFALHYMQECAAGNFLPTFSYYVMNGEPGGGEDQFLAKAQNATTMKSYFSDFKLLMQRAKDFGKPVLVLLEPDGFAYLEMQSNENPNAFAAVASTGLPELASLPNTVAGWGMAFLKLRNAVGANNVVLGIHVSDWATGDDIAYSAVTLPLQPVVDQVYAFLAPLGLAPNATGSTYDLLVGDPLDRDADYYRLVLGDPNRWWDPSDSASIDSRSFNRYAEWLRLWNQKAARRWVLWQIPLGNSNALNVTNNGGARQGYKDNRTEYFFAGDTAHLAKFANVGVVALLYGRGANGQMTQQTDVWTDGKLFMKTHAGAFLAAGGMSLTSTAADGGTADAGSGDAGVLDGGALDAGVVDAGAPDSGSPDGGGGTAVDPAQYGFESGVQGWTASADLPATITTTTQFAFLGTHSLAVQVSGTGSEDIFVSAPSVGAGQTITFHVLCPNGTGIQGIQAYVMQGASGGWTWTDQFKDSSQLTFGPGAWNTFQVTVPANAAVPLDQLGIELTLQSAPSITCYIDSVGW